MSEFELEEKQSDGAPLREHLKSVWRSTGKMPKQLEIQGPPELAAHLWGHYLALHKERPNNGFGSGKITATTVKDWCQVYCVELDLWEVKAIGRIDDAWLKMQSEKKKHD